MSSNVNELQVLLEEEKSLYAIASKMQDQLNRLKVEELALINQIREEYEQGDGESSVGTSSEFNMKEDNFSCPPSVATSITEESVEELDLSVGKSLIEEFDEEESEEEEDEVVDNDDRNDLTALMQQLHENNKTLGQY